MEELDRVRLLEAPESRPEVLRDIREAGLVYASEVRQGDRSLNGKEPGGPST